MTSMIDNVDFHNLPVQKYWSAPSSWTPERRKQEVQNAIFSGDYIGSRKMDGAFYQFIKDNDSLDIETRNKAIKKCIKSKEFSASTMFEYAKKMNIYDKVKNYMEAII